MIVRQSFGGLLKSKANRRAFGAGNLLLVLAGAGVLLSSCGQVAGDLTKVTGAAGVPTTAGACLNGPTSTVVNIFDENPRTHNSTLAFNSTLVVGQTFSTTLGGLNGTCVLQSDRFKISKDSLFPNNLTRISGSNTALAPSQPEFQQVNSFYYATSLRNTLVSLGADLSGLGMASLDAHCNQKDNAFYTPSTKEVCLGYTDVGGGKKVWAADDADVVVHESGHSMNHTLASTNIMNSSAESSALDESIADYWAFTVLNDPQLAEWFLGAISSSLVRDATQNHLYPDSMVSEPHDDGRVLTEVLWDLRQSSNLGKSTTDQLVKKALQLLPATTRFADFYNRFYLASGPTYLNLSAAQRSLIVNKFTAKGIHRADSASGLRLSTASGVNQVFVIDDHSISGQAGGNCNGVLDVGETALVLVNLENPNNTKMGIGVATLGTAPSGIQIPSGGQIGEFHRFGANSNFVSSLPTSSSNRDNATINAGFLIKATSAGVKNFSLTFVPMYSDPTGGAAVGTTATVSFSLTVGTTATSSSCTNGSLWP